ncbi:hypothetical protein [Mycolicibacterium brisbanense]|nr:hypothetical protein [Mycolicibacterium brisbanense]MCV7162046.1 hypothetical protein [Mycolicibacterium brisbanense]
MTTSAMESATRDRRWVLNAEAAVLSIALCRTSMQPVVALTVAWCAR